MRKGKQANLAAWKPKKKPNQLKLNNIIEKSVSYR